MQEMNQLWDERLDAHGIDAVTWQQGDEWVGHTAERWQLFSRNLYMMIEVSGDLP